MKIPLTVAILALAPWLAQLQIGLLIYSAVSPKDPRQRPPLDEVFTSVNETLNMPCVIVKIPATVAILALAPWVAQNRTVNIFYCVTLEQRQIQPLYLWLCNSGSVNQPLHWHCAILKIAPKVAILVLASLVL